MRAPEVSVLLPVRDEAEYLGEALGSLAAQTFEDFEAVVGADGSTDGTHDIAAGFALDARRFRVIRTAAGGVVAAAERARAEARGRFVARMDGDDRCRPERLALQVEAADGERLAVVGGA